MISVPHGITLHNGMFKNKSKNFRFVLPDLRNYSDYYRLIFYNNISLDLDKFDLIISTGKEVAYQSAALSLISGKKNIHAGTIKIIDKKNNRK